MNRRKQGASRASRVDPRKVKTLFARAVRAIESGDATSGRQLLARADAMAPSNPQILFNLGYANHAVGRFAEAVQCYRRCAELDPSRPETWINMANAARSAGMSEDAIRALQAVLDLQPGNASLHNDLGTMLAIAGRVEEAVSHYTKALKIDSLRVDTRANLGDLLRGAGRVDEAQRHYQAALDTDPGHARSRRALAALLDQQNRIDEAESVLLQMPASDTTAEDHLLAGNLQLRQGRASAAEESYRQVLSTTPAHPAALNNLGLVRVLRGDRDEAQTLFRRAIAQDGRYTEPWRHLAALGRFDDPRHPDIVAMQSLWADASLPQPALMHLGFALGKALDDCGRYDEAFEHFRLANELRRADTPFDAAVLDDHARRIRAVFAAASSAADGIDSSLPVYIVGMPRTGTTLLEQMLSAHPAFHGAGELLLVNRLIARLETAGAEPAAYPECLRELRGPATGALAEDYLRALREVAPWPGVERISDKMPYNFFHLGLVRMLFPHARILHCTRHPLDACLSAWFNYFPRGLDFTYAFDDLVAVYGIYRAMMDHWRRHPSVAFLDVSYEELVCSPKPVLRDILAHLALPWDDAVLAFHRQQRDVQTLSAWQVRRPLHTGSRQRWRHYAAHIGPLIEGLAPWLDAHGPDAG